MLEALRKSSEQLSGQTLGAPTKKTAAQFIKEQLQENNKIEALQKWCEGAWP